jgi:hypothetical protein
MEETMRSLVCLALSAVLLVFVCSASRARTAVYRCVLENGHISYQQIPCKDQGKPMALNDQRSGWSPLRPGEQSLLKSYRDKDAARRRAPSERPAQPPAETRACWQKRKQLEAVRAKLHRGYQLKEGDELHRKLENYQDYLRQFCS